MNLLLQISPALINQNFFRALYEQTNILSLILIRHFIELPHFHRLRRTGEKHGPDRTVEATGLVDRFIGPPALPAEGYSILFEPADLCLRSAGKPHMGLALRFERERHKESVPGWHACVVACAEL